MAKSTRSRTRMSPFPHGTITRTLPKFTVTFMTAAGRLPSYPKGTEIQERKHTKGGALGPPQYVRKINDKKKAPPQRNTRCRRGHFTRTKGARQAAGVSSFRLRYAREDGAHPVIFRRLKPTFSSCVGYSLRITWSCLSPGGSVVVEDTHRTHAQEITHPTHLASEPQVSLTVRYRLLCSRFSTRTVPSLDVQHR